MEDLQEIFMERIRISGQHPTAKSQLIKVCISVSCVTPPSQVLGTITEEKVKRFEEPEAGEDKS